MSLRKTSRGFGPPPPVSRWAPGRAGADPAHSPSSSRRAVAAAKGLRPPPPTPPCPPRHPPHRRSGRDHAPATAPARGRSALTRAAAPQLPHRHSSSSSSLTATAPRLRAPEHGGSCSAGAAPRSAHAGALPGGRTPAELRSLSGHIQQSDGTAEQPPW